MSVDTKDESPLVTRGVGVLMGAAIGDALGLGYEDADRPLTFEQEAKMIGSDLFAPGEWSDDTQLANAITQVATNGVDLSSDDGAEKVAAAMLRWWDSRPARSGGQTGWVMAEAVEHKKRERIFKAEVLSTYALQFTEENELAAGNGALIRSIPVAVAHLHDREKAAAAARRIAELTHADPVCGDASVLLVEMLRVAMLEDRFKYNAGVDLLPDERRGDWIRWLGEAISPKASVVPGSQFNPNGWVVAALQAAIASVHHTPVPKGGPRTHSEVALLNAVRVGGSTGTVGAVTGALLGARWGVGAFPDEWREQIHGWPKWTEVDFHRCTEMLVHPPEFFNPARRAPATTLVVDGVDTAGRGARQRLGKWLKRRPGS